jgi:anti-sigma B factor antagonist
MGLLSLRPGDSLTIPRKRLGLVHKSPRPDYTTRTRIKWAKHVAEDPARVRSSGLTRACHSPPEGIRCDYWPFPSGPIARHTRAFTRLWREDLMVLNFTTSRIDGVIVVYLSGGILFGEESASLLILVKDLLKKSRQIVLDLGNVTHFDSGSVGTLVAVCASARKVGGDIKFANLGNHIKEVLQITKFFTVFEIFGKTEVAIASFNRVAEK